MSNLKEREERVNGEKKRERTEREQRAIEEIDNERE